MSAYFVSRHRGAISWAKKQGIEAERVEHLDILRLEPGDIVMGSLPVHLAARVCERGARYLHLVMNLPEDARGKELTPGEMDDFGARLEEYVVRRGEA